MQEAMGVSDTKIIKIQILNKEARDELARAFEELEQELRIEWLGVTLTTAALELIENAVKANLKRVFFLEHKYEISDPESYAQGIAHFKREFPSVSGEQYRTSLKELDLQVSVQVDYDRDRLLVYIENNTLLLSQEEMRIRKQLGRAMEAEALVQFSLHYGDETEGSGLGLAMIIFLIRTLGFKPEHFRIYNKENRTMARLEFPLSAHYVPIRERHAEGADHFQDS